MLLENFGTSDVDYPFILIYENKECGDMIWWILCWFCSQVGWGEVSMINAERRLLGNALKDPDNQHFVLLSDRYVNIIFLYLYRSRNYHGPRLLMY